MNINPSVLVINLAFFVLSYLTIAIVASIAAGLTSAA